MYSESHANRSHKSQSARPGQIRHLLRVTEATSRHPERDAAILLFGLCCGLRCTETAQITVADVLFPSGKLRTEVSLRAAITKGCKQRCIYVSSPKLIAALERYIAFRIENRIGAFPEVENAAYRGLRHDLPLFMTRRGGKLELNIKRRVLQTGEHVEYWAADSLQSKGVVRCDDALYRVRSAHLEASIRRRDIV